MNTWSVTIVRSTLRDALTKLLPAIDTGKLALPVTKSVLLEASDGGLTLSVTDFDVFVRISVPCDCEGSGAVALPAQKLAAMVASLPTSAPLKLSVKSTVATMTAGRTVFTLPGLDADEFPMMPVVGGVTRDVDARAFVSTLLRCAPHCSTEPSRPALWTICLDNGTATASDGQSLVHTPAPDIGGPFMIFGTYAPKLAKLFGGLAEGLQLAVSADDGRMRVEHGGIVAVIRLPEGPYPAFKPLLAQRPTRVVILDRIVLLAAIQRVALTGEERTKDIQHYRAILTFTDELSLSSETPDIGSVRDVVPLETGAESTPLTVNANAVKIATALNALTGSRVRISLERPETALFFSDPDLLGDASPILLVMPLRSRD